MFEMPCRGVKKENCREDHVLILKPNRRTSPIQQRVECSASPEGFSPCFSRDSNWTPPKYKSEAIPLQKTHTTPALNYSAAWFVTGYPRDTRYIAIAEETYAIWQRFDLTLFLYNLTHGCTYLIWNVFSVVYSVFCDIALLFDTVLLMCIVLFIFLVFYCVCL
jgi:hypothetical protein